MADRDCTTSIYPPVYTKATLQAAFLHTCPVCGDRFSVEGRRGPKGSVTYCSRTCWSIGNAKDEGNLLRVDNGAPVYRCLHCEAEFTGRKRKYCGDECSAKAKNERKMLGKKRMRPFSSIRRPNPIIDGMRQCIDCGKTLPLSEYGFKKDNKCRSGKTLRGICKACELVYNKKRSKHLERTKKQRQAERARMAAKRGRDYTPGGHAARRTPFSVLQSRLAKQNARQAWDHWMKTLAPDDWMQSYYDATGKPWNNPRLTEAERYRVRYSIDPSFAIKERIRRQVTKAAKRDGVGELLRGALRRGGQSPMAEKLLGYGIDDLRLHLERQFTKGMNWDRFMSGEIHIDHIIPQSHFDMRDENQWRKCWCLSNLQPLWARENLEKRDRVLFLL